MNRISIKAGDGLVGLGIMKFTLTYQGELRADDNYRRKWEIRNHFHPQLEELWRVSPVLQRVWRHRSVPPDGWLRYETHHSVDHTLNPRWDRPLGAVEPQIDLCAALKVGARRFCPLVRDSYALQCGLKITFLRKEEPGRIYQGGDLDNRLKTLLDALSVPNDQQIVGDGAEEDDPIYCLMENDRLVRSLSVDTHRLLGAQNVTKHQVNLTIEVDVRVAQARLYNQPFLGD